MRIIILTDNCGQCNNIDMDRGIRFNDLQMIEKIQPLLAKICIHFTILSHFEIFSCWDLFFSWWNDSPAEYHSLINWMEFIFQN